MTTSVFSTNPARVQGLASLLPSPAPLPFNGYRAMACAVLADAVLILRRTRPAAKSKWASYEQQRAQEIAFFRTAARSAPWCEMAGFDWAALVSMLDKEKLLEPDMHPDVKRRGPRGPYGSPHIGIGRIEETLPRNPARAMTARELSETLGVVVQYVNRCLCTLEIKGRALRAGMSMSGKKKGERAAVLWYRRAA